MSNIRGLAIVILAITAAGCKIDPLPPRTSHDADIGSGTATGGAGTTATGGTTGTAGATATGGEGTSSAGGTANTGGTKATGGIGSTGGTTSVGGTTSAGGAIASGGTPATGGASTSGGASAAGGTEATGGIGSTGGTTSVGGTTRAGGAIATGGTTATGGASSAGGASSTGGAQGGNGTGESSQAGAGGNGCAAVTGTVYFCDDFENGLSKWTVSGQDWNTTSSTSRSPTHAVTDSPDGNYSIGADVAIAMATSTDLAAATAPILAFWYKLALASDYAQYYDYAYVELSSDGGVNWTNLATWRYFSQNTTTWALAQFSLSAYVGKKVKVRFRLHDNGAGMQADGWYIDDVVIQEAN